MYVSKCGDGDDGTRNILTSGGMSLSAERWHRSRTRSSYPDVWEKWGTSRRGARRVPRVNSGRDGDRRLECGACSASETCPSVFFRARWDSFSSSRWDSRYDPWRTLVLTKTYLEAACQLAGLIVYIRESSSKQFFLYSAHTLLNIKGSIP